MGDGIQLELKNERMFRDALRRLSENTSRDLAVVMKEQAKGVIRNVIEVTPPGGRVRGSAAKQRGMKRVATDIQKVLRGVPKTKADTSPAEIGAIHSRNRKQGVIRGRVKAGRARVPKSALRSYIRAKQKNVGFLAAGWGAAAKRLGYSPPAWIARHASPSSASIHISKRMIHIKMTNRVRYASQVRALRRRVDFAIKRQADAINRRIDHGLKRAARRQGFKAS